MNECSVAKCHRSGSCSMKMFGCIYKGSDSVLHFCEMHFQKHVEIYFEYKELESRWPVQMLQHLICIPPDEKKTAFDMLNTALSLRKQFQSDLDLESTISIGHDFWMNILNNAVENLKDSFQPHWQLVVPSKKVKYLCGIRKAPK